VLDDLTPLYQLKDWQLNDQLAKSDVILYQPRETYRTGGFTFDRPGITLGKNPPNGAVISYYLRTKLKEKDTLKLEFLEADGKLIKSFLGKKEKKGGWQVRDEEDAEPTASVDSGMNRFVWDRRYPDAVKVPGAIMWSGSTEGPEAIPGKYQVRLRIGDKNWIQPFEIRKDPRVQTSQEDFKEQFDFLIKIRDKVSEAHRAVNTIRDIRKQTEALVARLEKHPGKDTVASVSKKLNEQLKAVEEEIIQVKIKSGQDALNYPIKLNDKIATLSNVVASADTRPTKQSYDVFTELSSKLGPHLAKFKQLVEKDLSNFNLLVRSLEIPAVIVKPVESDEGKR
jgi:hypothetical protein